MIGKAHLPEGIPIGINSPPGEGVLDIQMRGGCLARCQVQQLRLRRQPRIALIGA